MKPVDEQQPDSRDLEALRQLYAQAPGDEPPAALDAAILASARKAVETAPRGLGGASWRAPLATAAVLVLSIIVVMQVQREQPEVLSVAGPAPRAVAPVPADVASGPQARAPDAASARSGAAREPATVQPGAEGASSTSKPAVPETSRAASLSASAPDKRPEMTDRAELNKADIPQPWRDAQPGMIGESSTLSAPVARALAPQDAAAPEARPPRAALQALRRTDSGRDGRASEAVTPVGPEANMQPEQWLVHLAALKAQGRMKEFQDSLVQFRKRYPDHRIPGELLAEPVQPR